MKKALSTIVLFVYFLVSTGFNVSVHYCMDRFDSAELGTSESKKCSKCGMHKDGGCCRDQVTVVKLATSHFASQAITANLDVPAVQVLSTEFLLAPLKNNSDFFYFIDHGPPLNDQNAYLFNRVLRL